MIAITKRNLKVFFRDRLAVFFSIFSVLIVIALYFLFLGNNLVSGVGEEIEGVQFLMDSWIMAGILAITAVTTTMGAVGIMVEDKYNKIVKDFSSSPIKNRDLAAGYLLSTFVIGLLISIVTLLFAELFIVAGGGDLLSLSALIKVSGIILLSVLSSSSMVYLLVSFFKSQNAFATASTAIGSLIGFLTGVYIPIGALPEGIQWIVRLFPVSHTASLFRQVMMAEAISESFAHVPEEAVNEFNAFMGVTINFGDDVVTPLVSVLILLGTTALFYSLSVLKVSKKSKGS